MKELLEKYPKAAKIVKDYYLEELIKGLKADLPEDFKEHVRRQGVKDETLVKLIELNPRALFSIFDEHSIYIQILLGFENLKVRGFVYEVVNGNINNTSLNKHPYFTSRLEAEKEAVKEAFSILESKLS